MNRVLGLLSVIVVTLTIGTTPVLAEYPEGCTWVSDGPRKLYFKGPTSDPKELIATFCNWRLCDIFAHMSNNDAVLSHKTVFWCE